VSKFTLNYNDRIGSNTTLHFVNGQGSEQKKEYRSYNTLLRETS